MPVYCNTPDITISFKPAATAATIPLDRPHIASGTTAVGLLGNDLDEIVLANGSASDTVFTIVVAKDV